MFTMVLHLLFFSKQFEDVWASSLWVLVLEFGPIQGSRFWPDITSYITIFTWYMFHPKTETKPSNSNNNVEILTLTPHFCML